jgi:hypothetical protein
MLIVELFSVKRYSLKYSTDTLFIVTAVRTSNATTVSLVYIRRSINCWDQWRLYGSVIEKKLNSWDVEENSVSNNNTSHMLRIWEYFKEISTNPVSQSTRHLVRIRIQCLRNASSTINITLSHSENCVLSSLSGIKCRVVRWMLWGVSKEYIASIFRLAYYLLHIGFLSYSSTLKVEVTCSSETSADF